LPDEFEFGQFMFNISRHIYNAEDRLRRQVETIINSNKENYRRDLIAKIKYELMETQSAIEVGKYDEANRHKLMAEILKSALDASIEMH